MGVKDQHDGFCLSEIWAASSPVTRHSDTILAGINAGLKVSFGDPEALVFVVHSETHSKSAYSQTSRPAMQLTSQLA